MYPVAVSVCLLGIEIYELGIPKTQQDHKDILPFCYDGQHFTYGEYKLKDYYSRYDQNKMTMFIAVKIGESTYDTVNSFDITPSEWTRYHQLLDELKTKEVTILQSGILHFSFMAEHPYPDRTKKEAEKEAQTEEDPESEVETESEITTVYKDDSGEENNSIECPSC